LLGRAVEELHLVFAERGARRDLELAEDRPKGAEREFALLHFLSARIADAVAELAARRRLVAAVHLLSRHDLP